MKSKGQRSSSKLTCSCLGKLSLKFILLTFLALTLYVAVCLVSSTAQLSVLVDMSIKMRRNMIGVLSEFVNMSLDNTINGSWTFGNNGDPNYRYRKKKISSNALGNKNGLVVEHSELNFPEESLKAQTDYKNVKSRVAEMKFKGSGPSVHKAIFNEAIVTEKDQASNDNTEKHLTLEPSDSDLTTDTDIGVNKIDLSNEPEGTKSVTLEKDEDSVEEDKSIGRTDTILKEIPKLYDDLSISDGVTINNHREEPPQTDVDIFGNSIYSRDKKRKSACFSCFNHNFNYIIQNENICKVTTTGQVIDLLILITTTHRNERARSALRSTWLTHAKNNTANIRYAFLLGEITHPVLRDAVLKENEYYHDFIKEDFIDSYKNLTYKTIMGFKWAATKCAHAKFIMKTDDDVYVNVPNLLKVFDGPLRQRLEYTLVGSCTPKANPIRNMRSKWFASIDSYPDKYYPGFCSGTGYVTSMRVARKIYEISPSVPFFHLEDVYVSLCINKLGYKLQHVPGFHPGRQKLDPCLFHGDKLITSHQISPIMMKLMWNKICKSTAKINVVK